ncbi:MAG: hypothetical protein DRJ45_03905 [Thermoprotei archaeon]|nr:MAG: hypothetical protein DRJ45_03905 [Thermoprotei archaeon]
MKLIAIQYRFDLNDYFSKKTFFDRIDDLMIKVDEKVSVDRKTLIVFPEDIGTMLIFVGEDLTGINSIKDAATMLIKKYFPKILLYRLRYRIGWANSLFLYKARNIFETYINVFSKISRRYDTYIIAGSLLLPRLNGREILDPYIYNTSIIFNYSGKIIGVQRKVHLISLEKRDLEVSPASLEEISIIDTEFGKIGLAICYDAFFDDVVEKLVEMGAEIVVQPSANPEKWDSRLERKWKDGCWNMVQKYDRLKYGVNPMAVGKILDLEFEGLTSIVTKVENTLDRSGYLAKSLTRNREEIIYVEV